MRDFERLAVATAAAMILATFTVTPLTADRTYLGVSWLLIGLITGTGVVLRRAGLGAGTVAAGQLLMMSGFVLLQAARMPGPEEPWWTHFARLWDAGVQHMQTQAAPMTPNDGVKLIFVTAIGVLAVVLDLVAIGMNRPVFALGPPLALFLVPAIGLGRDTGIVGFGWVALGYLGVLVVDGINATAGWTRGLTRDSAVGFGTATPVVWRAAGLIGAPALALTVVLGAALPTLNLPGFGIGTGPGGSGPLQLADPTLDLRRNLNRPADVPVMEYRSESPSGEYLRMASLPQFSSAGWTNVQMRLTDGQVLGPIPGVSDSGLPRRTTTIRVLDFGSEYLPLPYAPRSFSARGEWAYDPNSLMVLSTDRRESGDAIRNLSYTVESADVEPDPEDLATAAVGTPADAEVTRAVPADLPQSLIDLTGEVTADADTPAAQAAAIQAYLRSSRFTYSTRPQPGSGYRALENFLLVDRTGYCEQFAASMALMARVAGIPTRVAVGFRPGERQGDRWVVTVHDMHAWPELFFAGYGWVRYEPTPVITGTPPAWTLPNTPEVTGPTTSEPSLQASESAEPSTAPPSDLPSEQAGPAESGSGLSWGRWLAGVGGGLVGLLVLAAPATIRVRRRSTRLSPDAPATERVEAAWAEIRDSVTDYGGRWPEGSSPRTIGAEIGRRLGQDESAAMTQVATLVERSRYARSLDDAEGTRRLPALTLQIRDGLAAPVGRWRRILAVLWPVSLFRRRR